MPIAKRLLDIIPLLWGNWISMAGTTLATVAGNAFLVVFIVDLVTGGANQYVLTAGYLGMPPLFIAGLALVALGVWRQRRGKTVQADQPLNQAVALVMNNASARRRVTFVIFATILNITLVSLATYKGVTYMNTTEFCGELCHSVMQPEHAAYKRSPHARVPCVDCHIGEGADWFARSKLSGLRQVWATATGSFTRPVPAPVKHLRPARETCEKCHWPQKFHGERLLVRHQYGSDEKNTRQTNVVRLNVGGENKRTGKYEGIHWHVAPDVRIEYEALDPGRKSIGKVVLTQAGKKTTYLAPKEKRGGRVYERRVMDCVDCHNRPTHIYDPSPAVALDQALAHGKLDQKLPFIRQQGEKLLKQKLPDPERAAEHFSRALIDFYKRAAPEVLKAGKAPVDRAARELAAIYKRNIYPDMKITWGTYPSHLGHRQTTEGCFRCHDDEHTAKDDEDKVIRQDCDICHEVLAEEEEKPDIPQALLTLGEM